MTIKERPSIEVVRRYAWMNVASSFLVWGIALAGLSMMMTAMYNNISQEMHWTKGQTADFMTIKSLVSAITGLAVGTMFIRFGLKRVYITSLALIGLSTVMIYFAHTLPIYYTAAALSGFFSIICNIAFQVTLARWFSARLGTIMGFALLGGACAGLIVPLSTQWAANRYGWHTTAAIAGLIVLIGLTTLVATMVHESPEGYGYTADEIDPPKDGHGHKRAAAAGGPPPGEDFQDILRSKRFYILLAAVFASGAFSNGINEHVTMFLKDQLIHHTQGLTDKQINTLAAGGLSLVMVVSALGKIAFGWVFDRLSNIGVALCWLLCGVAVLLAFPATGTVTITIFLLFRGLAQGGVVAQAPVLARHMFGMRPVAQTIGFLTATFHLGAACGISLIGLGRDHYGSYTIPFIGIIIIAFIASATALTFQPKYWARYKG